MALVSCSCGPLSYGGSRPNQVGSYQATAFRPGSAARDYLESYRRFGGEAIEIIATGNLNVVQVKRGTPSFFQPGSTLHVARPGVRGAPTVPPHRRKIFDQRCFTAARCRQTAIPHSPVANRRMPLGSGVGEFTSLALM